MDRQRVRGGSSGGTHLVASRPGRKWRGARKINLRSRAAAGSTAMSSAVLSTFTWAGACGLHNGGYVRWCGYVR